MDTLNQTDVIAGLRSPRLVERDDATRLAILTGRVANLLDWEGASPSERARRQWTFLGVHLRRAEETLRAPRADPFRHVGTLASALEAIGALHGVPVGDIANGGARVQLDIPAATLLAAFDAACAQAGCVGAQGKRGDLVAIAGAPSRGPQTYLGPMRLRAVELRTIRASDFTATRATAQVRLGAGWAWPLEPIAPTVIDIAGVRADGTDDFTLELPEPTDPIAIRGTLTATFDGPYTEAALVVPGALELHGLALRTELHDGGCTLHVEPREPARAAWLGLSPVVLAVSATGDEAIPQLHRVRTLSTTNERWTLRPRDGFGAIAELRVRVAAPPVRRAFVFALPPTALP